MNLHDYLKSKNLTLAQASEATEIPVDTLKSYSAGRAAPSLARRKQLEQWSEGAIHRHRDWGGGKTTTTQIAPRDITPAEMMDEDPLVFAARLSEFDEDDLGSAIQDLRFHLAYLSLKCRKLSLTQGDISVMAGLIKTLGDAKKRAHELGEDKDHLARLEVACLFLPDPFHCPLCGGELTQERVIEHEIERQDKERRQNE